MGHSSHQFAHSVAYITWIYLIQISFPKHDHRRFISQDSIWVYGPIRSSRVGRLAVVQRRFRVYEEPTSGALSSSCRRVPEPRTVVLEGDCQLTFEMVQKTSH